MINAFLLTRQWTDTPDGIQLEFWFSTDQGPLQLVIDRQRAVFFIEQQDAEAVTQLLGARNGVEIRSLQLTSFNDQAIAGVYFTSQQQLYRARDLLQQQGIRCYESDIRPTERYLTERFITGPVMIQSAASPQPAKRLLNSKLKPDHYRPRLKVVSLDIETAFDSDALYSIAFLTDDLQRILMIGDGKNENAIEYCANERELLQRFIGYIRQCDPDILIGWNVINFDLRFLQRKAEQLKIPLTLGRDNSVINWRQSQAESEQYFIHIPGRVVLDGIDTLKSATYQFDSFSLESVGNQLLGRGKLINDKDQHDPLYKARQIKQLFHNNKPALAAYNLEDCQLVWDIFEHTDLINFAIERTRLTGLEMDRIGGSVAAFDNLYLHRFHQD